MTGWRPSLRCTNCGRPSPEDGLPYHCPHCRGHYDLSGPLRYLAPAETGRGVERFRATLPLTADTPLPSLGEGDTPLIQTRVGERMLHFKCEQLNPTGSFKDRGSVVLAAALLAAGVGEAIEDSSGNAGASLAAYAARAGLSLRVFVPDYAAGPKRLQIEAYGARVERILGPRSETAKAALRAADSGSVYASHVYLPFGLAGLATLAYELLEQLGEPPASVVLPVGHGTLLLGVHRGFLALRRAGAIDRLPRLIGVQARACAPLWAVSETGAAGLGWVQEGETVAEGIRILQPLRGDAVLAAVAESEGRLLAVDEDGIALGRQELARRGLWVEPTSAVVWPGLLAALPQLPDPVVAVLTGSGFKAAVENNARIEGAAKPSALAGV